MGLAVHRSLSVHLASESPQLLKARALGLYHRTVNLELESVGLPCIVWPGLLLLYERYSAGVDVLADVMTMPTATALRWLKALEERGLVARGAGAGREYLLSASGKSVVEGVLGEDS